ncbi:hypothetical protein B9Z19DRAFT_1078452 [Tuber borchii]|uniref:Uncharacterized protein n=1 Tax=Tuber borchii TaxID=42251 RepID=A0A2T6ZZH4_TUBBO|nr:hypothetical protein B9Z19DRAFT_1078452 [Tuber borchii]
MIYEEVGKREDTLIQFVDRITAIYEMANESGILVLTFMSGALGKKKRKGESSEGYLNHHEYGDLRRIGTALKKILDLFAIGNSRQSKPLLELIVTKGRVGTTHCQLGKAYG